MPRKIYSANLDQEKITKVDSFIIPPVSRSDIIDSILGYVLQSPDIIEHFVQERLREFESIVNNEQGV